MNLKYYSDFKSKTIFINHVHCSANNEQNKENSIILTSNLYNKDSRPNDKRRFDWGDDIVHCTMIYQKLDTYDGP